MIIGTFLRDLWLRFIKYLFTIIIGYRFYDRTNYCFAFYIIKNCYNKYWKFFLRQNIFPFIKNICFINKFIDIWIIFNWRATSLCNLKILAYNCFFEYLFGIKNQERHLHLQRQFGCRKYIYRHIVYKHQISQIIQKYPHRYDNHFS